MVKAIIIDDETKARENLSILLKDYCPNVNVVASVGNINGAVEEIQAQSPDCVFLDIKMKGELGFDLFEKLEEINFKVVFTTAFDEYALKALKLNAIDYLLKPIDIEELKEAVEKVEESIKDGGGIIGKENIQNLLRGLTGERSLEKIAIPTVEGLKFINIKDIIRCESDENYTMFFFTDGDKKLVSKTIKFYDELLSPYNFFRTHRSHLVNLNHVKEYYRGDGGSVLMSDGSEVLVARRKKEAFLQNFNN